MIVVSAFFISFAIILIVVVFVQNQPPPEHYGIVLDAGSSSTVLYVYRWQTLPFPDVSVRELLKCTATGGSLASFGHRPHSIYDYFQPCLERAAATIPRKSHSSTHLFLGATAGLRLMLLKNSTRAGEIMTWTEKALQRSPFMVIGVEIISGQREGGLAWLGINYVLGRFPGNDTVGALDLGGASTQVAFLPRPNTTLEDPDEGLTFVVHDRNYTIYTHSFLCYGKEQALWQKIADSSTYAWQDVLAEPCFHPGYSRTVEVSKMSANPCTRPYLPERPRNRTLTLRGTGDSTLCQMELSYIFNFTDCPYSRCAFNGVYQPEPYGSFVGTSAFYYVMSFFKAIDAECVKSPQRFNLALSWFCSLKWSYVKSHYNISEEHLATYCFGGNYILTLLTQGYGLSYSQWAEIQYTDQINNLTTDWALGYVLTIVDTIPPPANAYQPLKQSTYTTLVILLSLILFLLYVSWLCICRTSGEYARLRSML